MEVVQALSSLHHHHNQSHSQPQQHQSQGHTDHGISKTKGKKSLSLENYLDLFHSRDHQNFNASMLNQILAIHGFKRVKHRKDLDTAMESLNFMNLTRSTLNDKTSSDVFLALEEVIKDLGPLNWQGCSVTSIRSINSLNNNVPDCSETVTKSITPKTKKRSKPTSTRTPTPLATSLNSEDISRSPNDRNSIPIASLGSGNNGSSGGSKSGSNGTSELINKRNKKRKGIKRIIHTIS